MQQRFAQFVPGFGRGGKKTATATTSFGAFGHMMAKTPVGTFQVPKMITIQDWRLGLMHKTLMIVIFVYTISDLVTNKRYFHQEPPSGTLSFYAEKGTSENLAVSNMANPDSFCSQREANQQNYEFWDGTAFPYYDFECSPLSYNEMWLKGEDELFFMTMYTDSYYRNATDVAPTTFKNKFVPGVEGLTLVWQTVYGPSTIGLMADETGLVGDNPPLTIKAEGHPDFVCKKGKSCKIPLKLMLEMSGTSLEHENHNVAASTADYDSITHDIDYDQQVLAKARRADGKAPKIRVTGMLFDMKIMLENIDTSPPGNVQATLTLGPKTVRPTWQVLHCD